METKLIKTSQAEYEAANWNGKNECGYDPIGDRVIILPDKAASQTSGGVYIDDSLVERLNLSSRSGIIIAMGEDAFTWSADRMRPWGVAAKPQPGDRVYFEKFSGVDIIGDDGKAYRVMDDKCIGAKRAAV